MLQTGKRSQASLEYVAILLILLIALGPLLYFNNRDFTSKNTIAQAQAVVQQISSTANQLRAQGQGSRQVIQITMPPNVEAVYFNKTELTLKVRNKNGGLTDVFATANANLTGSIPNAAGVYFLNITVLSNGNVSVSTSV